MQDPRKLQKWIRSGRKAIEHCLVDQIVSSDLATPAQQVALAELKALAGRYNALLAEYEQPVVAGKIGAAIRDTTKKESEG